jgi:hypothetical protein
MGVLDVVSLAILDGYDWSPYFKGETRQGPRKEFLYWTDDGGLAGHAKTHQPTKRRQLN